MKDYKKAILGILKKRKDSGDKFESQVLKLTLKQIDGARDDGWGVFTRRTARVWFRLRRPSREAMP